jgi:hypothetical protein
MKISVHLISSTNHISRNQDCACYSKIKYKLCHGHVYLTQKMIDKIKFHDNYRIEIQKLSKPIISCTINEIRHVIVGITDYYKGTSGTFHEFLFDFLELTLGYEWIKNQSDDHPIIILLNKTKQYKNDHYSLGLFQIESIGATDACLTMAYNLYILKHHYPSEGDEVIKRLKSKDQFSGAYHELNVFKFLILSGLKVQFSKESKSNEKCVEGIAEDENGVIYGFEAKSSNDCGEIFPNNAHPALEKKRAMRLIRDALEKKSNQFSNVSNVRILFIELSANENEFDDLMKGMDTFLMAFENENKDLIENKKAYIIFTNNPYQLSIDGTDMKKKQFIASLNIPELNNLKNESNRKVVETILIHPLFCKLSETKAYEVIPHTFDNTHLESDDIPKPRTIYALFKILYRRYKKMNREDILQMLKDSNIENDLSKEILLKELVIREIEKYQAYQQELFGALFNLSLFENGLETLLKKLKLEGFEREAHEIEMLIQPR